MSRRLGQSPLQVSPVGLGAVTFGREIDEETSRRILDYAVEKGITYLDTAESYGGGNAREYRKKRFNVEDVREKSGEMSSSERILGTWLKDRNCYDQVTVCSKCSTGNSPENLRRAIRDSVERLQMQPIDVYLLHNYDTSVPLDETLAALADAQNAGLIGVAGCSNFDSSQLADSLRIAREHHYPQMQLVEPIYNLARPEHAQDLFPLCRQETLGITSYSPLGAGFLTGKYTTDDRSRLPQDTRFFILPGHCDIYFSERNFRVVEQLRRKAEALGVTMADLAMRWAMANTDVTVTLIGARRTDHIDSAVQAATTGMDQDLWQEMAAWS